MDPLLPTTIFLILFALSTGVEIENPGPCKYVNVEGSNLIYVENTQCYMND